MPDCHVRKQTSSEETLCIPQLRKGNPLNPVVGFRLSQVLNFFEICSIMSSPFSTERAVEEVSSAADPCDGADEPEQLRDGPEDAGQRGDDRADAEGLGDV